MGVVGDLMLDRYVWGSATRISQEAPIPVVQVKNETARPGGAANVLHNITSLGGKAIAFGVIGDDANAETLLSLLGELDIATEAVVRHPDRITTEKTRIIAGNQQVVRVDSEREDPLAPAVVQEMLSRLRDAIDAGAVDGLIIEDYAKGTLNRESAHAIVALAERRGVPVALDPHPGNPLDLTGLTLMTPNRAEAFAMAGRYLTQGTAHLGDDEPLLAVAERLRSAWAVRYLLVTLGAGGMALFRDGDPPLHVPTQAREVFDVSGAGDTVITSFMLALLAGANAEEAAVLSNHAAGVVVGKVGTAPVYTEELLASFQAEQQTREAAR